MPNFIDATFWKFNHPPPQYPQYSPHKHYIPVYAQKEEQQYDPDQDKSFALSLKKTKWI